MEEEGYATQPDELTLDEVMGKLDIDAENAFNNLNRKAALKNIKEICPPLYQYLDNTYQKPAKLCLNGSETLQNGQKSPIESEMIRTYPRD